MSADQQDKDTQNLDSTLPDLVKLAIGSSEMNAFLDDNEKFKMINDTEYAIFRSNKASSVDNGDGTVTYKYYVADRTNSIVRAEDFDFNTLHVDVDATHIVLDEYTASTVDTSVSEGENRIQTALDAIGTSAIADFGCISEYQDLIESCMQMDNAKRELALNPASIGSLATLSDQSAAIATIIQDMTFKMEQNSSLDESAVVSQIEGYLANIGNVSAAMAQFEVQIVNTSKLTVPESLGRIAEKIETFTNSANGGFEGFLDALNHFSGAEDKGFTMSALKKKQITDACAVLDSFNQVGDSQISVVSAGVADLEQSLSDLAKKAPQLDSAKLKLQDFSTRFKNGPILMKVNHTSTGWVDLMNEIDEEGKSVHHVSEIPQDNNQDDGTYMMNGVVIDDPTNSIRELLYEKFQSGQFLTNYDNLDERTRRRVYDLYFTWGVHGMTCNDGNAAGEKYSYGTQDTHNELFVYPIYDTFTVQGDIEVDGTVTRTAVYDVNYTPAKHTLPRYTNAQGTHGVPFFRITNYEHKNLAKKWKAMDHIDTA